MNFVPQDELYARASAAHRDAFPHDEHNGEANYIRYREYQPVRQTIARRILLRDTYWIAPSPTMIQTR